MRYWDYWRRWFGTAASFAIFGTGGLLQGLLIHPLIWLLIRNPAKRHRTSRRIVSLSMRLFIWIMQLLGVLEYVITGQEHIEKGQPFLIVANHPSLIDVVFLLAIFPEASCVVKAKISKNPLFFLLVRSADYISNDDPVTMICKAVDCLNEGNSLIMFPEGTRTNSNANPCFSNGAAAVALRAGCSCLPVFIKCEPTTLTRQDSWYKIPDHKVCFSAAIQPPLKLLLTNHVFPDQRAATNAAGARLQEYFVTSGNLSKQAVD